MSTTKENTDKGYGKYLPQILVTLAVAAIIYAATSFNKSEVESALYRTGIERLEKEYEDHEARLKHIESSRYNKEDADKDREIILQQIEILRLELSNKILESKK
ncbi:MAG: hypothetical protein AAFQ92_04275 [Bacteroidota bacterium]